MLKFKQSPWLKEYIDINTQYGKEATHSFEINLFKLMNNAVFGKTCEDVRRYTYIKIVIAESQIKKLSSKEQFKRWRIYSSDLAAVAMERKQVKINKPRYIGSTILAFQKH